MQGGAKAILKSARLAVALARQIVAVRKRETKSIEKDREGGRRRGKEKKRPGERKKET